MLLESPAFLRWLDAPNRIQAAAKLRLFDWEEDPADLVELRPLAVILGVEQAAMTAVAWGFEVSLLPGASVAVLFTDRDYSASTGEAAPPHSRESDYLRFAAWMDLVLADLRNSAGIDDRLPVERIEPLWPITHSPPKDDALGAYWHCSYQIVWGR